MYTSHTVVSMNLDFLWCNPNSYRSNAGGLGVSVILAATAAGARMEYGGLLHSV